MPLKWFVDCVGLLKIHSGFGVCSGKTKLKNNCSYIEKFE